VCKVQNFTSTWTWTWKITSNSRYRFFWGVFFFDNDYLHRN